MVTPKNKNSGLKVLHLSTFDICGGAAKAANRLHNGLLCHDIQSRMLVQNKKSDDWRITRPSSKISRGIRLFRPFLDSLPLVFYPHRSAGLFSTAVIPDLLCSEIKAISPDIIHVHWINYGFVRLETFKKISCPIVWTFHDMWPMTGGCHVDKSCGRYVQKCGACPQLVSKKQRDLSHHIWAKKLKALRHQNITVVTPSKWLAECTKQSSLFKTQRICVIPNGLDLNIFKPVPKSIARQIWNLPQNKKIILLGAINITGDFNKGFHLVQDAVQSLKDKKNLEIVIFGADKPKHAPELGVQSRYIGQLQDEISMATLYSAADVMVVPSLQEAFGQTASEALACGSPVVAFNTTGLADVITHKKTGYLAKAFEALDLTQGISWILEKKERYEQLSSAARERAVRLWSSDVIVPQYLDVYQQAIETISFDTKKVGKQGR